MCLRGACLEKQVHALGVALECGGIERRPTSALGGGFEGGGLLLPGAVEWGKDPNEKEKIPTSETEPGPRKRPRTCSAVPFSCIFWGGRCTPEASHVQVSEKTALPQKKSTAPPGLRAIDVRCVLAGSGSVGDSELRGGGLEGLGASVRSSECYTLITDLGATHWDESSTMDRAGDRGLGEEAAALM